MIAKKINIKTLEKAICIAFNEDFKIFEYYDESVRVETINEVCDNVFYKITTFYPDSDFFGVYDNNELIGYFVSKFGQLISFALKVNYRVRKYLRKFFALIKQKTGKPFICFLYSRNIRGIKWLLKNKMILDGESGLITRLVYI